MEAPLPQPSQPGVISPPLRSKPIPPPRNPSFRRGSQDGRNRTDGMRSPTSNPSSPLSSPQHVPAGNRASPATSPQRKPDVARSHVMPQQPVESSGNGSSPLRTGSETLKKGTVECLEGPERRGGDATTHTSPEIVERIPDSPPQTFSPVSNFNGTPLVPIPQQRTETKASGTNPQWIPADRQPWRNEMSTSFSSSPYPAPLDIGTNHIPGAQQMLERTRQSPVSPRWIQPGSRGTDDNRIQHLVRMGQVASMSLAKMPQMEINEDDSLVGVRVEPGCSHGIRETCLESILHPHGVPNTVTDSISQQPIPSTSLVPDYTSPQNFTGTRLVSDIAKGPESQVVSPKRIYSYSVILTGTSNIQSNQKGNGLSVGSGSPSHMKSETPKSPVCSTESRTSPLVNSFESPPTTNTSDVTSIVDFQPSADPTIEPLPAINPTSPKRNLMSKPPLPYPAGQRVGSTDGHLGSFSSTPSSLQYIAPKSSLYSGLNPVPVLSHNSSDVSQSISSTEPGSQPTPVQGPALVPEFTLASPHRDAGSLSSLDPGPPVYKSQPPAPDSMSYLDSVSMMSGTVESLSLMDDASSMGSDSEVNGMSYRRTDKYGFLGGNQFSAGTESSLPVDVARQREMKWLDMFKHWDKWVSRRFQKVKLRCRKGIPSSLRARAWQHLSNSKELIERNPGKFEELERDPGDPKWLDVIEKDLHRQFPFHEMFVAREGHGQKDLYRILKAYTIYRPDEGYCQAQAPVAAVLLMHMPAEQAFWCLVQICEKYLPGYYSAGLEAIQLDGEIFFALLRRASPMAYRHLKKYKIDPILYMTEWFMCIFSRTLPWSSVLRVWDMFFCEGVKIIFRVGLAILRHTLGSVDKLRSCQGMYETMEKLRSLPNEYLQESFLVQEVCALPVTEALIERENSTQLKKWRENRGELQYKPSRRLHGTRVIFEEHHRMNPLTTSSSLLSLTSLRRASKEERWRDKGQKETPGFSPAHSIGNLALSSGPSAAPSAATVDQSTNNLAKPKSQKTKGKPEKPDPDIKKSALGSMPPGQVVSEGLHPALPSPTGNVMPLGEPKKPKDRKKDLEKQRAKEQKEKEKHDRERERLEKEMEKQRAKEQKEKERLEKEKERKLQKERDKEEARQKKERKLSVRKKDVPPVTQEKGAGDVTNQPEKVAGVRSSVRELATQVSTEERAIPTESTGVTIVQDSYF